MGLNLSDPEPFGDTPSLVEVSDTVNGIIAFVTLSLHKEKGLLQGNYEMRICNGLFLMSLLLQLRLSKVGFCCFTWIQSLEIEKQIEKNIERLLLGVALRVVWHVS